MAWRPVRGLSFTEPWEFRTLGGAVATPALVGRRRFARGLGQDKRKRPDKPVWGGGPESPTAQE